MPVPLHITALIMHWVVTLCLRNCLLTKLRDPYIVLYVSVPLIKTWFKVQIQLVCVEFMSVNVFLIYNLVTSLIADWQIHYSYFLTFSFSLCNSPPSFSFKLFCTLHSIFTFSRRIRIIFNQKCSYFLCELPWVPFNLLWLSLSLTTPTIMGSSGRDHGVPLPPDAPPCVLPTGS